MNRKLIWMIGLFFLVSLLLVQEITAFGVAPSRRNVDFEPGKTTYTARIINSNHEQLKIAAYAKGDLADHVTIKEPLIIVEPEEGERAFEFEVDLPEDVQPGLHSLGIVLISLPDTFAESDENFIVSDGVSVLFENKGKDTLIGASIAVIHQLQISVPYPGEFVEGQLYVSEAQKGEDATFTVSLINRGESPAEVYADIAIKGPTNEVLAEFKTNTAGLEPTGEGKVMASYTMDLEQGNYVAEATVHYGGTFFTLDKVFAVGNRFIDIRAVNVDNFRLGGIAQFDVFLKSRWNEPIEDVYGELEVIDESGNRLSTFNTLTTDIESRGEEEIQGYWDTEGVEIGTYDVNIVLHYAGKTTEKLFQAIVGIDNIDVVGSDTLAGQVIGEGGADINWTAVLIAVVVLLILVNLGWFLYFRKRFIKK